MKITNLLTLAALLPAAATGRLLGGRNTAKSGDTAAAMANNDYGSSPEEDEDHEHATKKSYQKQMQVPQQEREYYYGAPKQTEELDDGCGTFVLHQSGGLVLYDDFEKFQGPKKKKGSNSHGILCSETSQHKGMCLGGNDDKAILVHGTCQRGFGYTTVSFVNSEDDQDFELHFACEASPEAKPSVKCSCAYDDKRSGKTCNGATDIPFQAQMRFGRLSLPAGISAHCTLMCEMPTPDS